MSGYYNAACSSANVTVAQPQCAIAGAKGYDVSTLGLPFAGLGYGIWSPEFTSLRKEEEFLKWKGLEHPEWVDKN